MSPKISARPGVWLKPPLPPLFALLSTLPFPGLLLESWASLVAQSVKNMPAMQETWV